MKRLPHRSDETITMSFNTDVNWVLSRLPLVITVVTPNLCLARVRCLLAGLKLPNKRVLIISSYQAYSSVCETLADKSMRIPAYGYQQGIQGPKIPLGGASSQS